MAEKLSQAKNIKLKLYLEGIEMPISQIQITEDLNMEPKCSLVLPLDEKILDLLPRTTVHVFYKDSLLETSIYKDEWILIFEGEVQGFNVARSHNSRTIMVNCIHISDHWKHIVKEPSNLLYPFKAGLTSKINAEFSTDIKDAQIPEEVKLSRTIAKLSEKNDFIGFEDPDSVSTIFHQANTIISFETAIYIALQSSNQKLENLMKKFVHSYAYTNIGYTLFHAAYQMVKRFRGIDNSKIDSIIDLIETKTLVEMEVGNAPGAATLMEMMLMTLNLFDYKMLSPTAPTFNETNEAPESFLFLPTPLLFTPPACNIIFKDEIISSGFSQDLLSAPTRMVAFVYPATLNDKTGQISRTNANAFITPTNQFHYQPTKSEENTESIDPIQLQVTREERFRGIVGRVLSDDISELRAQKSAQVDVDKLSDTEKEANKNALDTFVKKLRLNRIESEFQKERLSSRTFEVSTYYSPFRIVGLPGVCMDYDLPNVMGIISKIHTLIDANGQATSQISFMYPKFIREEGKITKGFEVNTLNELLAISGVGADIINNSEAKEKLWPFIDKKYSESNADKERWKTYIIEKLNNYEDLVFLNSWYDQKKFFPTNIGREVYKEIMYGIKPDATEFGDSYKFEQAFFTNLVDGSIGIYHESPHTAKFDTGNFDNRENTNWIAHYLKAIRNEYDATAQGDKHRFIHKTTRRRIITESQFWKFLLNLDSTQDITNIDSIKRPSTTNLGLGIRSINTSLSEERKRILELLEENGSASAPFIEERRVIVRQLKSHLERTPSGSNTYLVGVAT